MHTWRIGDEAWARYYDMAPPAFPVTRLVTREDGLQYGCAVNTHTHWQDDLAEARALRQAYDRWTWGERNYVEVRNEPYLSYSQPDTLIEFSGPTIDSARRHTSKQYQHGFADVYSHSDSPQRTRIIEDQATAQL